LPLVRISSFVRYVRYLESDGAPVGRLLAAAGIPEALLDYPASAVPQDSAFRFGDLVCRALGIQTSVHPPHHHHPQLEVNR
jgi:hypothetical protein